MKSQILMGKFNNQNTKKSHFIFKVLVVFALFFLFSANFIYAQSTGRGFKIKLACQFPKGSPLGMILDNTVENIKRISNNELDIVIMYLLGSGADVEEVLQRMIIGSIQAAIFSYDFLWENATKTDDQKVFHYLFKNDLCSLLINGVTWRRMPDRYKADVTNIFENMNTEIIKFYKETYTSNNGKWSYNK
jgi:hypothetical protein